MSHFARIFAVSALLVAATGVFADQDPVPLGLGGLDVLNVAPANTPVPASSASPAGDPFVDVFQSLRTMGVDQTFLAELMHDSDLKYDEVFIQRNLLNFLEKDNYRVFLTKNSVNACRKFLTANTNSLKFCQKKYGVPKEVITALLWVETKHGHDLGRYHVASIFMNLALSSQQAILDRAVKEALSRAPATGKEADALKAKVSAAGRRKAAWATEQLVALSQMRQKYGIDVKALKGSYSGAFGIPQFVPTSFMQWAADGDGDGKIDLFGAPDAICSVANYLKTNGWGRSASSHKRAVYNYNRSDDYGKAVLGLARKLKGLD